MEKLLCSVCSNDGAAVYVDVARKDDHAVRSYFCRHHLGSALNVARSSRSAKVTNLTETPIVMSGSFVLDGERCDQ